MRLLTHETVEENVIDALTTNVWRLFEYYDRLMFPNYLSSLEAVRIHFNFNVSSAWKSYIELMEDRKDQRAFSSPNLLKLL